MKNNQLMIGLALLAPLSSFAEENGANKKKPNIIYILADDLGISELGCYGQQLIETPNTVSYTHLDVYKRQCFLAVSISHKYPFKLVFFL